MTRHILQILEVIAALGTLAGLGYYSLCIWGAARFLREGKATSPTVAGFTPPISILKPLKGTDPEMYESFRSHCLQEYPEYELIFGVSDVRDPATALVERLKSEFPQRTIRLVACPAILGGNIKVSNLAQMLPEARHEYLIVNDSDIRVAPDYLARVAAPFTDPSVGLVTCLYRGVPAATLGSRLEALGISTDFCGGVLAARVIEGGMRFGLGSTLALRRRDLAAMGGFEAVVDYLADDYELGARIFAQGLKVQLANTEVETFLPAYSWSDFWGHQLRWARSVRDSRPWGYAGLVMTFGLPWALLTLLLARGNTWALILLIATVLIRLAQALVVGSLVVKDRYLLRLLALLPVRDLIAVCVWIASFGGHKIAWRGDSFTLKDGKLIRT